MRFAYFSPISIAVSKAYFIAALVTVSVTVIAQADVYVGPNVSIGSNVVVNSNKVKVSNTTVNEKGVSIPANAGYLGSATEQTTYTCTAKSPNVDFEGNNQKVTVKGKCQTISIKGENNLVIAQQTFNLIESGINNTVSITKVRHVMSIGENTSLTYRSGLDANGQ
ncbi:DUF3060 domain-containing protein [Psychrobacter sp. DAB_AL43B]|uniref:DUF3060 domain-containing protein n=1 Tax=Psychrobacter sp. DAB_AL43B TaxID=1028416 RepID=UPI0009A6A7EF|nr:DUF3060 domain-containing protein [Psychrobacter sp. DAB_AL43B]SLJ84606.1 hypothetical protein DABAL43B_1410 [Psychrobacter sp. DAB_AL43B]